MAAERNAALVGKLRPSALLTLPRALPPAWERSGRCARLCYRQTTKHVQVHSGWGGRTAGSYRQGSRDEVRKGHGYSAETQAGDTQRRRLQNVWTQEEQTEERPPQ